MERSPARPDTRPARGQPMPAPESGGSLPPWSSFGLGPDAGPPREPAWDVTTPAGGDGGGGTVPPELLQPEGSRGWLAVVLLVCLLLGGALAYVFLETNWIIGHGTGAGTPAAAFLAPVRARTPPPTATRAPAVAAAKATRAPAPVATRAATVTPTAPPSPPPTLAPPILVAADTTTVNGVSAASVAAGVRAALAGTAQGRTVEVVGGDRRAAADVVIGADAPPGYQSQTVATNDFALVTSARLPLYGVSHDAAASLLDGQARDWQEAGAPISLPVEVLALQGQVPAGAKPAATYPTYDALVAGLDQHPGGVALVPVAQVDARVNVLAIDGTDPLRGQGDLAHYPYAQHLYVATRDAEAAAWQPALAAALQRLGLPRADPVVTAIGVVGDIVPGRGVHRKMVQYNDFTHPFRAVAGELSAYDLTFGELAGDLSTTIPQPSDPHANEFVSDPKMIAGMKLAGIDGVSLANGNVMLFGQQGLSDTMAALRAAGMPYVGAGANLDTARRPHLFKVHGLTVALLGINGVSANPDPSLPGVSGSDNDAATADTPGTNPLVPDRYLADIKAAAKQADIVIPYFSMGVENTAVPPSWVVQAAHGAIDAGATAVVITHPHWIEGVEFYKGKPIVYSLGNFVFDQEYSVQVRQGMILELTFRGKQLAALRVHGVEIEDFNQPRPMTTSEQASFLGRFWDATDRLVEAVRQAMSG